MARKWFKFATGGLNWHWKLSDNIIPAHNNEVILFSVKFCAVKFPCFENLVNFKEFCSVVSVFFVYNWIVYIKFEVAHYYSML